jgi:mycothione reductase
VANAEVKIAFWNIANPDSPREMDYRAVPNAVFSGPQVASVGKKEEDLLSEGVSYRVGKRDFGGTAYGWALDDHSSFAKVLVDDKSDLILGAHIIGPQAASLIQPLIQAMQFSQTATDLATKVFYIHPALTEVVENALLAAADAPSSQ